MAIHYEADLSPRALDATCLSWTREENNRRDGRSALPELHPDGQHAQAWDRHRRARLGGEEVQLTETEQAFIVPKHLFSRPLPRNNQNPLAFVADQYEITTFGQITPSLLRVLYKGDNPDSHRLFWRVVSQLAFFGVMFTSPALRSKNVLGGWQESLYLWPPASQRFELMRWGDGWLLRVRALENGLILKGDTLAVPLKSLQSLVPKAPFVEELIRAEGIQLVDYRKLLDRTLSQQDEHETEEQGEDVQRPHSITDSEPKVGFAQEQTLPATRSDVQFVVADHKVVLPAKMHDASISVEDFPRCPYLVRWLRHIGYTTWGSLPHALDDLLLSINGVGERQVKKFFKTVKYSNDIQKTQIRKFSGDPRSSTSKSLRRDSTNPVDGVKKSKSRLLQPSAAVSLSQQDSWEGKRGLYSISGFETMEATVPRRSSFGTPSDVRFKVGGHEVVLPPEARDALIAEEDFPHCPSVVRKLHQMGYPTWGSLPYALDDLLLSINGIGRTHVRKFSNSLVLFGKNVPLNRVTKSEHGTQPTWGSPETPLAQLHRIAATIDAFPECPEVIRELERYELHTLGGLAEVLRQLSALLRLPVEVATSAAGDDVTDRSSLEMHEASHASYASSRLTIDLGGFLQGLHEINEEESVGFLQTLEKHIDALQMLEPTDIVLWWQGKHFVVPAKVSAVPLGALCNFAMLSHLAKQLLDLGYQTVGDLPVSLGRIFERAPSIEREDLSTLLDAVALSTVLSNRWKGDFLLDPLVRYAAQISNGEHLDKIRSSRWDVFAYKLDRLERGERPTLQEMGDEFGITRERVRQILLEIPKDLAGPYLTTIMDLKLLLQEEGHRLSPLNLFVAEPIRDARIQHIVVELLNTKDIHYDSQFGSLFTVQKSEYQRLFRSLKERLEQEYEGMILTGEELTAVVHDFVAREGLSTAAAPALCSYLKERHLTVLANGKLGLHLKKDTLALMVFEEYAREHPEGVALYRDATVLRSRLDGIQSDVFSSDPNFISSLLRTGKVILWGRGRYIPREQIRATDTDVIPVAQWIRNRFRQGVPQMSSRAGFGAFREQLEHAGIPNDYALYSCLRLFCGTEFFLPDYPKIFPAGQLTNLSNGEMIEDHLFRRGDQSYKALEKEFVALRGWQPFQVSFTVANTPSIIRTGHGVYGSKRRHRVSKRQLQPLADHLQAKFYGDLDAVSIRLLFRERRATCRQLGINNEYLLYTLMAEHYGGRFLFRQFPHVGQRLRLTKAEQSNVGLVEEFLRGQRGPVLREELTYEFEERRGWTAVQLNNAIIASLNEGKVFPLQRGRTPEYVHRALLGWNDDKCEKLEGWVRSVVSSVNQREFPFAKVRRELLDPAQLPTLESGIEWTEELLKAMLANMHFLVLLGTKDSVFAAFPNTAGVEDDEDFVAYVLEKEFGGAAKASALQTRLRELDFRIAQLSRPENGEAGQLPYYFVGDEILLRGL